MPDPSPELAILYTTWPDAASAQDAARVLLGERLIACANILGASTSIFEWEGAVQTETETVALFKTAADRAEAACARLIALHPYDEPCVVNLGPAREGGADGFARWVAAQTRPLP